MREIEAEVRRDLRSRIVVRGGADDYSNPATFAVVERILRRAVVERSHDALLLPELLPSDPQWQPEMRLRIASHRRLLGGVIVSVKRRILLPLTRWLYEYCLENFRRQQRVNLVLFSCVEELAIENAKLRQDLEKLTDGGR